MLLLLQGEPVRVQTGPGSRRFLWIPGRCSPLAAPVGCLDNVDRGDEPATLHENNKVKRNQYIVVNISAGRVPKTVSVSRLCPCLCGQLICEARLNIKDFWLFPTMKMNTCGAGVLMSTVLWCQGRSFGVNCLLVTADQLFIER